MKHAILYARVSSREQADEGFSIPAQLKLLREYAADRGFEIAQEFVDVETAKQAGRTAFGEMVEFLRRRHKTCRTILVEKTDRLYRNLRDYVTLDDLDLEIHFAKEGFILSDDSRSTEKFMHGIKVLMAKNYVDNLSEEASKGMREKAEQGTYPSAAPVGYLNVSVGEKRGLAEDAENAPIVRRMFEWYATGHASLDEVRARATAEGLRTKRGGTLSKGSVERILKNPFYVGVFQWRGRTYQGDHPHLVPNDLFQRAQEAFDKGNHPVAAAKRTFAYTGLVTCAHCGCAVTAEVKKSRYVYYHCTGSRGECPKPAVREERLEELLGELVKAVVVESDMIEWVKLALRESHHDEEAYHSAQLVKLQTRYTQVQANLDRAYDDKLEGKITEEFWTRRSREWRQEQIAVRTTMEKCENANRVYFDEACRLLDLAGKAYDLWLTRNAGEKRQLLNLLLSNCTFDGESLTASYGKPFCWLAEGSLSTVWRG